MKSRFLTWALVSILLVVAEVIPGYSAETSSDQQNLVVVDNDFTGPPDTLSDLRCALMFLESPNVKVLGFTMVTGDGWRDEEVAHLLRLEEISGRTDVPVVRGAVYPLVNTPEEMRAWEKQFGQPIAYKGAWDLKEERTDEPDLSRRIVRLVSVCHLFRAAWRDGDQSVEAVQREAALEKSF
jgi:hypothetical protein